VLRIMPATLAAFSSAQRVTLAGSIMPASTRLMYGLSHNVEAPAGPAFASHVLHDDTALECQTLA
jgi:hypothetical protein